MNLNYYTDGSSIHSTYFKGDDIAPSCAAWIIMHKSNIEAIGVETFNKNTAQACELIALSMAIDDATERIKLYKDVESVTFHTDSEYSLLWIEKRLKFELLEDTDNYEHIKRLYQSLENYHRVHPVTTLIKFSKVKAHVGEVGNTIVDKIAHGGSKMKARKMGYKIP